MNASLRSRLDRLERQLAPPPPPHTWDDAMLIAQLMDESVPGQPDPQAREEAVQRLRRRVQETDPDNPQEPTIVDQMIAGILDVNLEAWAVNDRHRQVLRDSKLGE